MIYYLVQSYSKSIDDKYHTHLYPSYLTSYNMKQGGSGFGLQSGLHDALKFIDVKDAEEWKYKAEEIFGKTKEFDIVPFDSRIFGKADLSYIIQ